MSYHVLSVLAGLLATSTPTAPVAAEVKFNDGSLVKMTMQQPALEVKTKYGKLIIPFEDIRRITFGRHVSEEMQKEISEAMKLLGSQSHRDREDAMRRLIKAGRVAYPFLKKIAKHADLEVTTRVNHLLKKLVDLHLPEELSRREEDVIQTTGFLVVGRIENQSLKAHSENFGELALKLSALRIIQLRTGAGPTELTVDAAKYGCAPDQWFDTDFTIDSSVRLFIKSEGQVDLWPPGPGQYVTGPKGYTTAGKGGTWMAGTLLGRIGQTGTVFVIGERYDGISTQEGKLFLHIVPSPWNNASCGNYRVRIIADFISASR